MICTRNLGPRKVWQTAFSVRQLQRVHEPLIHAIGTLGAESTSDGVILASSRRAYLGKLSRGAFATNAEEFSLSLGYEWDDFGDLRRDDAGHMRGSRCGRIGSTNRPSRHTALRPSLGSCLIANSQSSNQIREPSLSWRNAEEID